MRIYTVAMLKPDLAADIKTCRSHSDAIRRAEGLLAKMGIEYPVAGEPLNLEEVNSGLVWLFQYDDKTKPSRWRILIRFDDF